MPRCKFMFYLQTLHNILQLYNVGRYNVGRMLDHIHVFIRLWYRKKVNPANSYLFHIFVWYNIFEALTILKTYICQTNFEDLAQKISSLHPYSAKWIGWQCPLWNFCLRLSLSYFFSFFFLFNFTFSIVIFFTVAPQILQDVL